MKKNVIITGGELFNKGAQAMTFAVISTIKKINPDINCILLSTKDAIERSEEDKKKYNFEILPYRIKDIFLDKIKVPHRLIKKCDEKYVKDMKNILNETAMMIDISGYVLSSDWGRKRCQSFLMKILIAKKYSIPAYIMPQSFGPLNFKGIDAIFINSMIRSLMPYPKIIYAREEKGYKLLTEKFKLKNVQRSLDTVLLCDSVDEKLIYKKTHEEQEICIRENSIAILPNQRTLEHGNKENISSLYKKIISNATSQGLNVYLISHAADDVEFCMKLKKLFETNPKVLYLNKELSCIEFERIIKKFNYLVASRYHSIVHAYKQGVPCVILGWADKYKELATVFGQEDYLFDISKTFNEKVILNATNKLQDNYSSEKIIINEKLKEVRSKGSFDFFKILEDV